MSESVGVGSCKARRPKPGSRLLRVRPWTGAALGALRLPGLLRVPADGVLQCSLAQRRLRRAPSEGAKSRLEMNVQSEFWRLPAGRFGRGSCRPRVPASLLSEPRRSEKNAGDHAVLGGLPARRAGSGELHVEMLAEAPILLGLRSGSRKTAKGRPLAESGPGAGCGAHLNSDAISPVLRALLRTWQ